MSQKKTALITGIADQDGFYLAEFVLEKGYKVHSIKCCASGFNTQYVDRIYQDQNGIQTDSALSSRTSALVLHYGDLSDASNLIRFIQEPQPGEIYNPGAQSHVTVSFEPPKDTTDRMLGLERKNRLSQTSTSEVYGLVQEMCAEMVAYDVQQAKQHALLKQSGNSVNLSVE